MKEKNYTLHYALIQAAYWMVNSVLVSYAAVFMQDKNFSNSKIGTILALASLFAVIMQPVVAAYIDKSSRITVRTGAMIVTALVTIVSFLMVVLQKNINFVPVLFILVYMFFQTLQPLNSSIGMECEEYGNKINFGLARGIGSWGYAVLATAMGYYLLRFSPSTLPIWYFALFIIELILISTFNYKDVRVDKEKLKEDEEVAHTNIIEYAKCYPSFMLFLVGLVLIFYAHMFVNNFAINLFENVGGNSKDMGIGVGLAAFLELPAMVFVTRFKDKINVKYMLIFAAIAYSVRHFIFWIATSVTMVIIGQALQMFAFAVYGAASVYYVNELMGKKDAVKGQAYVVIGTTIGGIFSSLIGGRMIDNLGFKSALGLGVILTFIGTVIVIIALLQKDNKVREND